MRCLSVNFVCGKGQWEFRRRHPRTWRRDKEKAKGPVEETQQDKEKAKLGTRSLKRIATGFLLTG